MTALEERWEAVPGVEGRYRCKDCGTKAISTREVLAHNCPGPRDAARTRPEDEILSDAQISNMDAPAVRRLAECMGPLDVLPLVRMGARLYGDYNLRTAEDNGAQWLDPPPEPEWAKTRAGPVIEEPPRGYADLAGDALVAVEDADRIYERSNSDAEDRALAALLGRVARQVVELAQHGLAREEAERFDRQNVVGYRYKGIARFIADQAPEPMAPPPYELDPNGALGDAIASDRGTRWLVSIAVDADSARQAQARVLSPRAGGCGASVESVTPLR